MPAIIPTHYEVLLAQDPQLRGRASIHGKVIENTDTVSIECGSNLDISFIAMSVNNGAEVLIPYVKQRPTESTSCYAYKPVDGVDTVLIQLEQPLTVGQEVMLEVGWEIDVGGWQSSKLAMRHVMPHLHTQVGGALLWLTIVIEDNDDEGNGIWPNEAGRQMAVPLEGAMIKHLQASLPLDDEAIQTIKAQFRQSVKHRSKLTGSDIDLGVWATTKEALSMIEHVVDVLEEIIEMPSPYDWLEVYVPRSLTERDMPAFLEALRSVTAQVGQPWFMASPSDDHDRQWLHDALLDWIAITIIGERLFPSHQPINLVALYNALNVANADRTFDLVQMMSMLASDFLKVVRRYLAGQGDFWAMMKADAGLDVERIAEQWRQGRALPTILVSRVEGGFALSQEDYNGRYPQIPVEIKLLSPSREIRQVVVGRGEVIVETDDMIALSYSGLYRVVYSPMRVAEVLSDYVKRPWILPHQDLVAIIRDNGNVSALERTLAPTPWIMMNRRKPSVEMCNRVLRVLGEEEVEGEAVANTVLRRDVLHLKKEQSWITQRTSDTAKQPRL